MNLEFCNLIGHFVLGMVELMLFSVHIYYLLCNSSEESAFSNEQIPKELQ